MTRSETPAHGLSDDDAQRNPFSDNSFQILMNEFVADLVSVDWLLKNPPGWDGVSRAVQHVAQIVERVIEFERRHAEHLLMAAKVNRKPLVDQPFSRHREREVIGFLKGRSVDALLGCDASQRVRQSFDEGRARFDLDVKQAIKEGDVIPAAKRLADTEIGTVDRLATITTSTPANDGVRTSGGTSTMPDGGGTQASSADDGRPENGSQDSGERTSKPSTERGEARAKIIPTWTLHHQYRDGGALNFEPIGVRELARLAKVSTGSVSAFFGDVFGGHVKYRSACLLKNPLLRALKEQNGDFSPEFQYDPSLLDERDEDAADRWDKREREGE